MNASAAQLPNFDAVMWFVEQNSASLFQWATSNRAALKASYEEALVQPLAPNDRLERFALGNVFLAVWRVALRSDGTFTERFRRPCCTKWRFTYPFCNPKC